MNSVHIPSGFLPPEAPDNARLQKIDFASYNLPRYEDGFAAVIDDVFTEFECKELIRLAEATTVSDESSTPKWERAGINVGGGRQEMVAETRNCGRIIWDTADIAQRLLDRLMPFLGECNILEINDRPLVTGLRGRRNVYYLSRLNERMRFLKYEGGEYFQPHWDAFYSTPDQREISFFTIHLYLNGEGEQNLDEIKREEARVDELKAEGCFNSNLDDTLLGGATTFIRDFNHSDTNVRVFPKTGSVLVFQQNDMLHSGDSVFRGVKYTLRTDIMYRHEPKSRS